MTKPRKQDFEPEDYIPARYTAMPRSHIYSVPMSFSEAEVFDDEVRNAQGGGEDGRKTRRNSSGRIGDY